jgi:hypothetical protein
MNNSAVAIYASGAVLGDGALLTPCKAKTTRPPGGRRHVRPVGAIAGILTTAGDYFCQVNTATTSNPFS